MWSKKEHLNYTRLWRKQNPWLVVLSNIKQRTSNPKASEFHRYGGRGILCLITKSEIKELWFRDKAYEMKKPSIDRIDNDGNYCKENCRFIEQKLNKRPQKQVIQLDLNKKIINIWNTQIEAAKTLNLHYQDIGRAIKLGWKCGNYYWKWKE